MRLILAYCENFPHIKQLVHSLCSPTNPLFCQFLLDWSVIPELIAAVQDQIHDGDDILHHLFHLNRTWVYTLHKERMKLLGRWNPIRSYYNTKTTAHVLTAGTVGLLSP